MRASFHPYLPNGLTGDPVVWIDLIDEDHAVLFDLGDLRGIPNRKLLRVALAVVTHTHLDHFFGFDHLLRVALPHARPLALAGPAGFLANVNGKLAGYTWNLIEAYPIRFQVQEIDGARVRGAAFAAHRGLRAEPLPERPFCGTIAERGSYRVEAVVLDHGIPVLGLALREHEHYAVDKARLVDLGLAPGPWLRVLKARVREGPPATGEIEAEAQDGSRRRFPLAGLAAELIRRSPGQEIAYLTDLRYTPQNVERAVALARGVQLLICEAAFLDRDRHLARERCHLTARQAGELAREAGVSRLAPVHLSPRYEGREEELLEEASRAFGGPIVRLPRGPASAAGS
jgi:ribonuclease Z